MPVETVPMVVRRKKTFVVQGSKPEEVMPGKQPEKPVVKAVVRKKAKPEPENKPAEASAALAKGKPGKKVSKARKINQRNLERLTSRWPELFCDPPKPLAIGVYDELLAQLDPEEGKSWLKRSVYHWVNRWVYKKALAGGGARFNLAGESGVVSPEDQQHATERLSEMYKQREAEKERRKLAEKQA